MRKSDAYLLGGTIAYLATGILAIFTHFVPIEVVQVPWLMMLSAPLVWPRLGRAVGIRSFWGNNT